MANWTVFYSWQSDLPRKLSRDVIHGAVRDAIGRVATDISMEDSPRLDHDTKDVAGTPEITGAIFKKIDECGAFVADLSFVGGTFDHGKGTRQKLHPNPNVLLELGYAARHIGWDRVILVMNTAFGPPEELIFDLRNRRFPVTFQLGKDDRSDAETVQKSLSGRIEEALRSVLQSEHSAVKDAIGQLDAHAVRWLCDLAYRDYFSVPPRDTMGQIVSNQHLDLALTRLIGSRLLRFDVSDMGKQYAYHWTYLGKLVLRTLNLLPSQKPAKGSEKSLS